MTACSALYGYDYMAKCAQDNRRLEANGSLLKLMLFVLIFSSNCSIVFYPGDASSGAVVEEEEEGEDGVGGGRDSWNETKRKTNTMKELLGMQDVYVTMLWKYMVYLYGYNQAAVRFSSMIKSVIDMFRRVEELPPQSVSNGLLGKNGTPAGDRSSTEWPVWSKYLILKSICLFSLRSRGE